MKRNYLLLSFLAIWLFASCSGDNDPIEEFGSSEKFRYPSPYSEMAGVYYWSSPNIGTSYELRINSDNTWSSVVNGIYSSYGSGASSSDYGVVNGTYLLSKKVGDYLYGARNEMAIVGEFNYIRDTDARIVSYLNHWAYKRDEGKWYDENRETIRAEKLKWYARNKFVIDPTRVFGMQKTEDNVVLLFANEVEEDKDGYFQRITIEEYESSNWELYYQDINYPPNGYKLVNTVKLKMKKGKLYDAKNKYVGEFSLSYSEYEGEEDEVVDYYFDINGNKNLWYYGFYADIS